MSKSFTPRLDLDPVVVERAKTAYAAKVGKPVDAVSFSATLNDALATYRPRVLELLEQAGFRKQNVVRGRPRRIAEETWNSLEADTEQYDVSRIGLVRAVLALLAHEQLGPAGANQQAQVGKQQADA